MAEFVNPIGKIRGKFGNVIAYVGANGKNYCKGANGFSSANVPDAVTVERINPDKPIRQRKKAVREFRGVIDYDKLRVAAGALITPTLTIEVDEENRTVAFEHQEFPLNTIGRLLDDKIYGVLFYPPNHRCRVVELGVRGETFNVKVDFPEDAQAAGLAVYVFATTVDGKDASDSACLRKPL